MSVSGELGTASAVVVEVPVAEPVVGRHRAELDPAATLGVPAHVTLLFPFLHPDLIDEHVLARLHRAIAAVPRFEGRWARTGWFAPGVLWLVPEPDKAWRRLIGAVQAEFPECPPYGGMFPDTVPHLTVGDRHDPERLREAELDILPGLPLTMPVTYAALICGSDQADSFQVVATFPLGL